MGNNFGVINEQGFPIEGANLGFKPLSESEKKVIEDGLKKKEEKTNNK